jgi:hypothetical protein
VAEWLGRALQKLLQRFESARDLDLTPGSNQLTGGFDLHRSATLVVNLQIMLTNEEKGFMEYWAHHRLQKQKLVKQLSVGLPMALALVGGIAVSLFSGWYTRAQMVLFRESASLIIVLLVAAVAMTIFMILFSARHRWELNEQRYQELMQRNNEQHGQINADQ